MSDPNQIADAPAQEPSGSEPGTPAEAQSPPWGDDFDPARAWHTIQSLREREKELSKVTPITAEQKQQLDAYAALENASKSESQRLSETAEAAKKDAEDAKSEAVRYKIALRHGIAEDDFDLLGSGTEEQIEARAVKVAEKNEAAKQAALDAAVRPPSSPPPTRPTEQLRPGASPSPDQAQDDSYYPDSWLSPSQRARVETARGGAST